MVDRVFKKIKVFKDRRPFLYKLIMAVFVIFIILLFAFMLIDLFLFPKIVLKGSRSVVVDYDNEYKEKGFSASFLGKDISNLVSVKDNINSKKIGKYEVKYKVKKGFFERSVIRYVYVKDRVKPKIDIDGSDLYVCPGDEVVPEKVSASDNYDGDLSSDVKTIIEKDRIIYRVKDSSSNSVEVIKNIIYKDVTAPIITLNGSDNVTVFVGEEFNDPSVNITDNCDGDISKSLEVIGSVDTSKVGEYTIKYRVVDKAGNEAYVLRKVNVKERNRGGTIYLTFDDGPNAGTTDVILDILKEEKVEATFFVTNKGPDELIKREFDEGHTVALHTASHDYATVYSSVDGYFNDLNSVSNRVKNITGVESKIIRFPGGSSNTVSRRYCNGIMSTLTNEVLNRGYKYYDWNISSGDAGNTTSPDGVYNNVVNSLRHDRVNMVLMHDIKWYTRDALRRIIRYGKDNGYTFEKITMDTDMVTQRVNN